MKDLFILSEIVDGRWRPGIGDPTVVGWLTVVAYLITAASCGWAAYKERPGDGSLRERPATFWRLLAVMMTLLGINKQLDLQTFLTQSGRAILKGTSRYEDRRTYQLVFIGVVVLLALAILAVLFWAVRRSFRTRWMPSIGMAFVLTFVAIRAASFHHVDVLLASKLGAFKWNWILELGGIIVIGLSALRIVLDKNVPEVRSRSTQKVSRSFSKRIM
jgi:hypothetical protein